MIHGLSAVTRRRHRPRAGLVLAAVAVATTLVGPTLAVPASALGGDPVTDAAYAFVAKVSVGEAPSGAGCTGALVAPQWVLTALDCFAADAPITLGAPHTSTIVTVGRPDLTGTGGQVSPVVQLVPYAERGVVLAKLATPVTGIAPVPLASTAPAADDRISAAGFGRTATEWVPDKLHVGAFTVNSLDADTMTITGATADAAICRGDAGGPAVRSTGSGLELVGLHYHSFQGGCMNETVTRRDAVEIRTDNLVGWIRQNVADVAIFGATADGHLTWSSIDSATGDRRTTITSAATLGFTPKAMTALNVNTALVTSTADHLYRVDVTATNPALTFATPVDLGRGWNHSQLSYDGDGSLFGIAAGTLIRYTVTSAKPSATNIINRTVIADGFTLTTLTATGPDWILGARADGVLRSYKIQGAGKWTGYNLTTSGWAGYTHVVSPGNGLYYARTAAGGMVWFKDAAPFDGVGTDLQAHASDPVDTSGWTQSLLSAVPSPSYPQGPADVSIFGVDSGNHLTYSAIDSATGDRATTVTSAATLGFTAKAMAALNFNTVLVTSTGDHIFRIDVLSTTPTLTFGTPVDIGRGWNHGQLAYDGAGSLYGIAGGLLVRYTVTTAKPAEPTDFASRTEIATGFTLTTLTATGPGWILGRRTDGVLRSYSIAGAGAWTGYNLASSGWTTYKQVTSPGAGLYYGQTTAGGMDWFKDAAPFDGVGTDIQVHADDPVDTAGWNQPLISAVPFIS
jgi:hypothetical protein